MYNVIKCKWGGALPPLKQHFAQSAAKGGELSGVHRWKYWQQSEAIRQTGLYVYGRRWLHHERTSKSPMWCYFWRHRFDANTPVQQCLQCRNKRSICLQANRNYNDCNIGFKYRRITECDVDCASTSNEKRHRRICFGGNDCSHKVALGEAVSLCG